MTIKAGQKCTAIRRAIVPAKHVDAVAERLRARLAKIAVGDPRREDVRMGALASKAQQADVAERVRGGTGKVPAGFQQAFSQALSQVSATQNQATQLQREVQFGNPSVSLEQTMIAMQKATTTVM